MIACPRCKSPDTVSYWQNKLEPSREKAPTDWHCYTLMKALYPDAGVCVDCSAMWVRPPSPRPLLALLTKDKQP